MEQSILFRNSYEKISRVDYGMEACEELSLPRRSCPYVRHAANHAGGDSDGAGRH